MVSGVWSIYPFLQKQATFNNFFPISSLNNCKKSGWAVGFMIIFVFIFA